MIISLLLAALCQSAFAEDKCLAELVFDPTLGSTICQIEWTRPDGVKRYDTLNLNEVQCHTYCSNWKASLGASSSFGAGASVGSAFAMLDTAMDAMDTLRADREHSCFGVMSTGDRFSRDFTKDFTDDQFYDLAQTAVSKYYWKPYDKSTTSESFGPLYPKPIKIPRKIHGGLHVCRSAMNSQLFLSLYRKYAPHLVQTPEGLPINHYYENLLKLAVVYHDSGNISEVATVPVKNRGKEAQHAINFYTDLATRSDLFDNKDIEMMAYSMEHKDGGGGLKESSSGGPEESPREESEKNIFQKLIHDADSLDIIRLFLDSPERYDIKKLDIYKDLKDIPGFLEDLHEVVRSHFETVSTMERDDDVGSSLASKLHEKIELSDDVCRKTRKTAENLFLERLVSRSLERGKHIYTGGIDFSRIPFHSFYSRSHQVIDDLIDRLPESIIVPNASEITSLFKSGLLVRYIDPLELDTELETTQSNSRVLDHHHISDARGLRAFINKQEGNPKVFTPQDETGVHFKWRPASFVRKGYSPKLFGDSDRIGVVIDPRHSGSMIPYLYKKNAVSAASVRGDFQYERTHLRVKAHHEVDSLALKTDEIIDRAEGTQIDPSLQYFGEVPKWTEALTTYNPTGLVSVIVPEQSPKAARDALVFRARSGAQFGQFCRYQPGVGLTPVDESEVILQSRTHPPTYEQMRDQLSHEIGMTHSENPNMALWVNERKEIQFIPDDLIPVTLGPGWKRHEIHTEWGQEGFHQTSFRLPTRSLSTHAKECILKEIEKDQIPHPETNAVFMNTSGYIYEFSAKLASDAIQVQLLSEALDNRYSLKSVQKVRAKLMKTILECKRGVHFTDELSRERPELFSMPTSDIGPIKRVGQSEELSSHHPVQYRFRHPKDPAVICTAMMKEGQPTIQIHLPDGKDYFINNENVKLREIALKYTDQVIQRLNEKTAETRLSFSHIKTGKSRVKVTLSYVSPSATPISELEIESMKAQLMEVVKKIYPDSKIKKDFVIGPEGISIETPYLQTLDRLEAEAD